MKARASFAVLAALALLTIARFDVRSVRADTFGSGANTFSIDFVTIGNPGNGVYSIANPAGSVPYDYRIGKYEIPEDAIDKANAASGLAGQPLNITKDTRGPDKPATSVTWFEAAQFVNWLNTSTGHTPAYKFINGNFALWQPGDVGYDGRNRFRNGLARYVLPSLNEWFKAAYYDPVAGHYWDYPTGSNAIPDGVDFVGDPSFDAVFDDGAFNSGPNDVTDVGLPSPYGTAGQGGNVNEWQETTFDRQNAFPSDHRIDRGGSWGSIYTGLAAWNDGIGDSPSVDFNFIGFRVVSVPEPNTGVLAFIVCLAVLSLRRRFSVYVPAVAPRQVYLAQLQNRTTLPAETGRHETDNFDRYNVGYVRSLHLANGDEHSPAGVSCRATRRRRSVASLQRGTDSGRAGHRS
jgi:formylglycine-generating enzyme